MSKGINEEKQLIIREKAAKVKTGKKQQRITLSKKVNNKLHLMMKFEDRT